MIKIIIRKIIARVRYLRLKFRSPNFIIDLNNFYCGTGCFVSPKNSIVIGSDFYMGIACHLASDAVIGSDVLFASRVSLVGGDHKIDGITGPIRASGRGEFKTITIEDNVWVGHGAIIMAGVYISSGAVVAAGSVVTKDVSGNAVVGGNPARLIRYREV
ncbi:2,3,4,5-tetrahydropyridine-2,6-dicarboxylate N-acetyltransferase [Sinobacterium norvegicum]|uniref:2,3,4,5-tetrahydropyridine-2,6-dicarboxylate N-acetyltransferase n=1 Tax=Sinobacterium norvegicum TaxID=1641715 RepID=A0ABN8ESI6_9GAMM|nr:acyltransferase [Sinobacterium norvegicum]CAH0993311.1 2,3,4,5-tetrahydropyridine-2,6-dicarboxylate N-acetyltransferase [Sinobacterium norvegicum]